MSGMLYSSLVLNKKMYLIALIVFAAAAVLGVTAELVFAGSELYMVVNFVLYPLQFIFMIFAFEPLGRDLERSIKSRFADYILSAGVSREQFALCELVKNLLTTAAAILLTTLLQVIYMIADPSFLDVGSIKIMAVIAVAIGVSEWMCIPLLVSMKSSEKAGLLVGVLAFVLGYFVSLIVNLMPEELQAKLFEFCMKVPGEAWFVPAVIGLAIALYGLFYWILLERVKRGEVC